MKSTNAPDIDPANNDSLAGTLQFCMKKFMQNMNGMLPAKVIKYDRDINRVQVQLLIALVSTDGSIISRAQIASIPVLVLGGGNAFLSFDLIPGDLGWVLANDRDISSFLQTYTESPPNTFRMNSFSDSMFIPDIMTDFTVESEDLHNVVLSKRDGSMRISLQSDRIKLTAPLVEITGKLQVDGEIIGQGGLNLSGLIPGSLFTLFVNGNEGVVGNIQAGGTITPGSPPTPPP